MFSPAIKIRSNLLAVIVVQVFLSLFIYSSPVNAATKYIFSWNEGKLEMDLYWNAMSRAGCDYAGSNWPNLELATERAYTLGARAVLRDEWNIEQWITSNGLTGQAWISEAETNCPDGHVDYPPHTHITYLKDWGNLTNTHFHTGAGMVSDLFVIPFSACNQNGGSSWTAAIGTWVDSLTENCTVAWQARQSTAKDLELRKSSSSPVYTLRTRNLNGDLSGIDVVLSGQVVYSIDITQFDPLSYKMVASVKDFRKNISYTESWSGFPTLTHLVANGLTPIPLSPTPWPSATPRPAASNTPTPPSSQPATRFNFNILLHGLGNGGDNVNLNAAGNFTPLHPQKSLSIEIFNSANQTVLNSATGISFNSTSGNFTGTLDAGSLPSGMYTLRIKVNQYLIKTVPGIINAIAGQSNNIGQLALVAGDVNNDNIISILDYNLLLDCFSDLSAPRNCTDSAKKTATDLTDDGFVNQFDYNLFLRELSVQSGE